MTDCSNRTRLPRRTFLGAAIGAPLLVAATNQGVPAIEELYDLDADPLEQCNLANLESHLDTMTDLRNRCSAWKTSLKPWNNEEASRWQEPTSP